MGKDLWTAMTSLNELNRYTDHLIGVGLLLVAWTINFIDGVPHVTLKGLRRTHSPDIVTSLFKSLLKVVGFHLASTALEYEILECTSYGVGYSVARRFPRASAARWVLATGISFIHQHLTFSHVVTSL
jgi:hypothetical protein